VHPRALGLVLAAVAAGPSSVAHAKCEPPLAPGWVRQWPRHELDADGGVLLAARVHGDAQGDQLVRLLGTEPALVSGDHRVPLDPVFESEGHEAAPELQLFLRPRESLRVGRRYQLRAGERTLFWNVTGDSAQAIEWVAPPRVAGRESSCAGESHLWIEVPVAGPAERIRFRATPTDGGPIHERIVKLNRAVHPLGWIDIGRTSCGGAAALDPGAEYRIQFWALDGAGREVAAPRAIVTHAPAPSDARPSWTASWPDLCNQENSHDGWLVLALGFLALAPFAAIWWSNRVPPLRRKLPRCQVVARRRRPRDRS
jgi:hypothetical protein